MSLIIPNLSIEGFRAFRKLDIGPFGRVNLITGKNNAGKSSLLEAIRILVTEGSPATIFSILHYREEVYRSSDQEVAYFTPDDSSAFGSLFSGFPILWKCKPITIRVNTKGQTNERYISISIIGTAEKAGDTDNIPVEPEIFDWETGYPSFYIRLPNRTKALHMDRLKGPFRFYKFGGGPTPCVFLNPYSMQTTSQIGTIWDRMALTDAEKDVVQAMQILAPDIQAVSMIGSEGGRSARIAIAKSSRYDHPVPLRSFGDGVNRLFGLILSLVSARDGVFLVDEIENGFHYSILPDVWRVVFRVAADLDIQVFATTHSWDCIDAFQKAASEHPEDGVLARLTVKDDQIIPTIFRESDLRIVTRDRIEVR